MNQIIPFDFHQHQVRVVLLDGEPWWVGRDVAAVLGYNNSAEAVRDHVPAKHRTRVSETLTPVDLDPQTVLISEAGMWRLVMRSKLPAAEDFQEWITGEVIPQIRRTGRYEAADEKPMTEMELAQRYVAALRRQEALKAELAAAAPKARSWDVLASGDGDYSVGDAAKILSRDPAIKLGRDRLFTVLAESRWVYRQRADQRWRPYQAAVEAGRLSELPSSHYHPRTGDLVIDPPQVRVTMKGLQGLHERLGGVQPLQLDQPMLVPA